MTPLALFIGRLARALASAVLMTLTAVQAYAQGAQFENWTEAPKGRQPKSACAGLRALTGYDLSIDTATSVPAQNGAAAFCLVQGLIMPEVRFEVALPADWNGRLYMFGNGGFAGEPLSSPGRVRARDRALQRGFATAQTNTGHDALREPLAVFASSPQKLTDYAYRAIHVTAMAAKALVRAYYDAPVDRAYFVGCSTGGRQGLIAAQRFPADFDGIVVGAPVLDFSGSMALGATIGRALESGPLSGETVRVIGEKVYARCDAVDGLADGLIADPRRCRFDVTQELPKCTAGTQTASCLTDAQADALRVIYGGLPSTGGTAFPGFPVGAEIMVPTAAGLRTGWHPWIVAEGQQTLSLRFAESFFKEMATPGTPIDWRTFEAERDADKLTWIGSLLDAKDPDLSAFRARGGKILMYFGWADPALTPLMGIDYYEQVRQTMGSGTDGFFRLFMQPGVLHCGGGPGPSEFDSITPLVDWVERGIAPDRLIATLRQDGRMVRSRPLCVYPAVARYKGSGNVEEAASFGCAAPE